MFRKENEINDIKEMLSVSEANGKTKVRINSSSLSIIQACERKAYYRLHEKYVAKNPSPATAFGKAIHTALEVFYSAPPIEREIPPKFKETVELMPYADDAETREKEEKFLVFRAIRAFIDAAQEFKHIPEGDKRSIPNGCWTLMHYFNTYIDDPYIVLCDEEGKPYVEREFSFDLYADDKLLIEYFGTIDVILMHRLFGTILVTDHKTSSMVGAGFFNRLKPNHQYTGYLLGAQKVLGIDTNKFLVNCVEVKAKPKTSRGSSPKFPRQVTTRSEFDFQEFTDVMIHNVRKYLSMRESGIWPLGDVTTCSAYAGCQYLDICSSTEKIRPHLLNAKFNKEDSVQK